MRFLQAGKARAAGKAGDGSDSDDSEGLLDSAEHKAAHEARLKTAAQPRYQWTNFPRLRDADDFAKGVLFNKGTVKANMLRWQEGAINKSLYDFYDDADLSKLAVTVHKNILGA